MKGENKMSIKKGNKPPRYDEAFKNGAVKMVTEQGRATKEVAAELGICIDTLKSMCVLSSWNKFGRRERNTRNMDFGK